MLVAIEILAHLPRAAPPFIVPLSISAYAV